MMLASGTSQSQIHATTELQLLGVELSLNMWSQSIHVDLVLLGSHSIHCDVRDLDVLLYRLVDVYAVDCMVVVFATSNAKTGIGNTLRSSHFCLSAVNFAVFHLHKEKFS